MSKKKLKVFTAFSGYDSQCLALNRLKEKYPEFDYELVGWSEIDPYAIKAHNALFPEAADKNQGDISKVNWEEIPDFDLFTYSSPCLPAGELILTPDGYRPIRCLREGDEVMTRSGFRRIAKFFSNGKHSTCYMHAYGLSPVHCTYNHRFWVRTRETEPELLEANKLVPGVHYLATPINSETVEWLSSKSDFWFMAGCLSSGAAVLCEHSKAIDIKDNELVRNELGEPDGEHCQDGCEPQCHYELDAEDYDALDDFFNSGTLCYDLLRLPNELLRHFMGGFELGCEFDESSNSYSSDELSSLRSFYILAHIAVKTMRVMPEIKKTEDFYKILWSYNGCTVDVASFEKDGYDWIPFECLEPAGIEDVYNIEVEDDHSYIVNGLVSSNCTDFSLAGKQAGGEKGSGTRSSLLWECERTIREKRPKYLLLENVTALCHGKFLNLFERWISTVNSYGYESFWQTLNAKDYGIPQNRDRVFLVSIRKDSPDEVINYNFPNKIKLEKTIEDFLENAETIDEKYYMEQEKVDQWAKENEERIINCIIERNKLTDCEVQLSNDDNESMEEKKEPKKRGRKKKVAEEVVSESLIPDADVPSESEDVVDKTIAEDEECCDEYNPDEESPEAWTAKTLRDSDPQTTVSQKVKKPIIEYLTEEDKRIRKGTICVKRIPTPTTSEGTAPTLMATGYANASYKNFYSVGHFPKLGIFEVWKRVADEEDTNTLI